MRIKISGGTVKHGESSLCLACRHATVVKGHRLKDQIVRCDLLSWADDRVHFPVTSCTGYVNSSHPTIREMEDLAWVLRTDATRKPIGFVRPRELKPDERYVLPDDED